MGSVLEPSGMGTKVDQSEQDSDQDSDALEDEQVQGGTAYITHAGAERLRSELKHLLTVERPKVTAEVSFAASLGDRSENADYIYGKKRLREIDRRLRYLAKRLEKLTIVDPRAQKDVTRIYFGARVELRNEDDGSQVSYELVGPDEVDLQCRRISVDSPIGRSLLGKREGEVVTVRRPKGEVDFAIIAVKYV